MFCIAVTEIHPLTLNSYLHLKYKMNMEIWRDFQASQGNLADVAELIKTARTTSHHHFTLFPQQLASQPDASPQFLCCEVCIKYCARRLSIVLQLLLLVNREFCVSLVLGQTGASSWKGPREEGYSWVRSCSPKELAPALPTPLP